MASSAIMTIARHRANLRALLRDRSSFIADATLDRELLASAVRYAAEKDALTESYPWIGISAASTPVGTNSITLPIKGSIVQARSVVFESVPDGWRYRLKPGDRRRRLDLETTVQGRPRYFWIVPPRTIEFYPSADAGYTPYVHVITIPESVAECEAFPVEMEIPMALGAFRDLALADGRSDAADLAAEARDLFAELADYASYAMEMSDPDLRIMDDDEDEG